MSQQNPELPLDHHILTDRDIAIKLVGVGGGGSNAVDRLKMDNLDRIQLAVINTDFQALSSSPVQEKLLIGSGITRGLGAGGDPELGRDAAEADREKIAAAVKDQDLVFLVAGMGGGTGSGAAPVVAEAAADQGALVIAFVTMPFSFEGGRRLKQAEEGLNALRRVCDAVIPLPNDVLMQEGADNESVLDSFARADEWIGRGVKSIWAMLFRTGLINLDFATLRQAFQTRGGKTLFGLGRGQGADAVGEAIRSLKMCPLLATPEFARRADRLLVNITGGTDLSLPKVNELMQAVSEQFGKDSHVVMGAVIDEQLQGGVEVCVLGTTDAGRAVAGRRAVSPAARARVPQPRIPEPAQVPASPAPALDQAVAPVPAGRDKKEAAGEPSPEGSKEPVEQNEFLFDDVDARGYFEHTDRNLYDGQDLDVPTYLRKGIKVIL